MAKAVLLDQNLRKYPEWLAERMADPGGFDLVP